MSNSSYPSSFPVAKLYRKMSEKGRTYFVGRWGGARVALLKSNDTADDGAEIWNLMLSEAPSKRDQDNGQRKEPEPDRRPPAAAKADWQRPDDTEIPF